MPKGDSDNLRADIDDGYAKIANLLMEALCCAPLTGAEYSVVLFIMRRTYGWAQKNNRATGKSDPMTAEEIAAGTATPRRTVEKCIGSLLASRVIVREPYAPGNFYAYGINCNVAEWGQPTAEWSFRKTALREARERETYTPKSVEVYAKKRTGIPELAYSYTPESVYPGAVSPTGTGAEGTSTDSITDITTKDSSEIAERASDGIDELLRTKAEKTRRDADRMRQQTERLDNAMAALTETDRAILDRMLAGQQLDPKRRGKPLTLLQQAQQVELYTKELSEHGPECWRSCCEIACAKEVYTAEYARGCTKNWTPTTRYTHPGQPPPDTAREDLNQQMMSLFAQGRDEEAEVLRMRLKGAKTA
jgi:phage replication O-like protein O